MKTQHTPGPWFMCEQKTKPHNHALVGIGNGAVHVGYASVTPALSLVEADANARLIAAAPDLLAQLEHLVGIICSMEGFEERDVTIEDCDDAKWAIAKAKGEK